MKSASISGNLRNFFRRFPELLVLAFWALVYSAGLHPDAPWGDGLGYAIAVQKGFDLACNANSHFAYLNFFHLVQNLAGFSNALEILGLGSVGWALMALFLSFRIVFLLSGKRENAIFSLNLLASCFAVWRLACVPEVYTMELAFFCGTLLCFLKWVRSGKERWFFSFALIHAAGILVHIHLILIFPLYIRAWFLRRKGISFSALLFYLIPLAAFFVSVEIEKLHSWSQILFENQQDQLLTFDGLRLLKGPFFSSGILLFMMPGILLYPFIIKNMRIPWKNPEFQAALILFLAFFAFASLYPDPGIFVFLLPVFMLAAIGLSSSAEINTARIWLIAPFQMIVFILIFFCLKNLAPVSWLDTQKIKGGPGFVSLPWAKGNVASVLEISRNWPTDSIPEGMRWNSRQVAVWDSLRLLNHQPD